jgi:hypothetical protein
MKKIMFIAFSFLMTTGVSTFAQKVVKVANGTTKTTVITSTKVEPLKPEMKVLKDSTKTTVITSTKVEPVKMQMNVPKDSTKTTVTATTKVETVKTEMKSVDLPQPVKDLGTNFKSQGWNTAETAYVVKGVTGDVVFYVVTFKNPTSGESKSINIDAKGNIVKE